jgi:hypothetical protein
VEITHQILFEGQQAHPGPAQGWCEHLKNLDQIMD